jgi:flagellar export protein FliJ
MKKDRIKKVLDLKGFTKEQMEIAVKNSKEALEIETAELDCTVSIFDRTVAEFNGKQGSALVDAQELDYFFNYFAYLNRRIEQQKQTVTEKITEVELKQKALMNAHWEKRLCEILYEKILDEKARDTLKIEQKEADFKFISRGSRR